MNDWAIGVDIGGTKIEIACVIAGKVQQRLLQPTHASEGYAAVEAALIEAIQKLIKQVASKPIGIGVGMAGQIDATTGLVHFAPNLRWHDVPLQENLSHALGLPVAVTNDVRAAAWGEWFHGAGRGCDDLVCLFIGTGIGGGIVSGGKMLSGNSNTAGELGHIIVDLNGSACTCGAHGCLEAIAGGWGIARQARDILASDPSASALLMQAANGKADAVTAQHVLQAFRKGDALAKKIVEKARRALCAGVVTIINGINPQRIILGGGIIHEMPELITWIDSDARKQALSAATARLEIMRAQLPDAPVVGAATFLLHKQGN